jgi:hypothetical protein
LGVQTGDWDKKESEDTADAWKKTSLYHTFHPALNRFGAKNRARPIKTCKKSILKNYLAELLTDGTNGQ